MKKQWNLVFLCALFMLVLSVLPCSVWADQNGAANAILNARNQILSCFDAVKDAEAAGANITELTGILNEAGSLLSQAEYAFSEGDFTASEEYAVQSQGVLVNLVADANALLFSARERKNQDFQINVIGSTVGTVVVLLGSWGLWNFLKRRSINQGGKKIGSVAV